MEAVARWTSAPSVMVGQKKTIPQPNIKSTVGIVLQKVSYHYVQKCAQPRRFSVVMETLFLTSIVSGLSRGALAPVHGVGALHIN
jgi:hypothetical protein